MGGGRGVVGGKLSCVLGSCSTCQPTPPPPPRVPPQVLYHSRPGFSPYIYDSMLPLLGELAQRNAQGA